MMPKTYKLHDGLELIKACCEKEVILSYAKLKFKRKAYKEFETKLNYLTHVNDTLVYHGLVVKLLTLEIDE